MPFQPVNKKKYHRTNFSSAAAEPNFTPNCIKDMFIQTIVTPANFILFSAQLVDCCVQTEEIQITTTEYPLALPSQENPAISSEKQPLEDDDEDYVRSCH